ncbi:MAG: FHA domain-containing protein [Myxococcales bacterium]|nr:FHA domain-containing protein [Myxococcales bacterium]
MARYRLKFLLQEFDLRGPEVVIGRSPECHVTIEDPLVSRRHAKVLVEDPPRIVDLGSRNGISVNGQKIEGSRTLSDGDRIRIGTQELVFYVATQRPRESRTTGFMTVCQACGTPYPEQSAQCPHCGAPRRDDDTISGLLVEPRRSWTFQLLGEVIERALATGRAAEADRILRRAAKEVDDRVAAGERLAAEEVTTITSFALRLAAMQEAASTEWVSWALNVHRDQGLFPRAPLLDRLEALDFDALPEANEAVAEFAHWVEKERDTLRPPPDPTGVDRLERLLHRN